MVTVPETLRKDILFKTDLKSLLRGLTSLLGLNMSRSRLKSIRIFNNNTANIIVAQIDLVKFILETDELEFPEDTKGVFYDEHTDDFKFITSLTGDPKESLFIFEDIKSQNYVSDLLKNSDIKADKFHEYKDLLSAVLDASQINNSILFVYHDSKDSYIINRSLFPYPEDEKSFHYYTKLFKVKDIINRQSNFVVVNRTELTITSCEKISDSDLSQMVLPVIHLTTR